MSFYFSLMGNWICGESCTQIHTFLLINKGEISQDDSGYNGAFRFPLQSRYCGGYWLLPAPTSQQHFSLGISPSYKDCLLQGHTPSQGGMRPVIGWGRYNPGQLGQGHPSFPSPRDWAEASVVTTLLFYVSLAQPCVLHFLPGLSPARSLLHTCSTQLSESVSRNPS